MNWIDTAKNLTLFNWVGISLLIINVLILPFMFKSKGGENDGWPSIQTIDSGSNYLNNFQDNQDNQDNQDTSGVERALNTHLIEPQQQHEKNHVSTENRHTEHVVLKHDVPRKKHMAQNTMTDGHERHSNLDPEITTDENLESELAIHGDMQSTKFNTDLQCYRIGPLKTAEVQARLQTQVEMKGMFANIKYTTLNENLGNWVYIPPKRSKPLARLLVEELKLAGFNDVILLEKNEPKYAISMGLFNDIKLANKHLLEVQSKGFNAKLESRHKSLDQVWLEVEVSHRRDLDAAGWATLLDNYPDVQLNSVNCP